MQKRVFFQLSFPAAQNSEQSHGTHAGLNSFKQSNSGGGPLQCQFIYGVTTQVLGGMRSAAQET